MTKKSKRSKKATKRLKRNNFAMKPEKGTKATIKSESSAIPVTRSKETRPSIAEGTRQYALAGRPTTADFINLYGPSGPRMTWAQRAKAGVDAKHFQAALKAKSYDERDDIDVIARLVCDPGTFRGPQIQASALPHDSYCAVSRRSTTSDSVCPRQTSSLLPSGDQPKPKICSDGK
jgi:hypothetical protein